jgi:peptide/nickel transport system permease protein
MERQNMGKYIGKRILMMIPIILGISFIIFGILELTPGDPARNILGDSATNESVEALREEMGLNDPFLVKYFNYVKNALRGDFGTSYKSGLPVLEELKGRLPHSLKLALGSILIVTFLSIPVGIISAVKQYSFLDTVSLIGAFLLTSMPSFWFGIMMILFFALQLKILPATGVTTWKHFVLPSIAMAGLGIAVVVRMTRSSMLEVIRQDYIRTARAKGASESGVIIKHGLKNALLPIITVLGVEFGSMLGGGMIIESVFAIPGIGSMTVDAIRTSNTPLVIASITFSAIAISIINLIVDILYVYIDPRLKSNIKRAGS